MIVDYRKKRTENTPLLINGAAVEQVENFQVPWRPHHQQADMVQAHQDSREEGTTKPQILKTLYSCTIESILTGCITAWYSNCSATDRKALQRVVRRAQYITGTKLLAIQDLYSRRSQRKALKIVRDSSHHSHRLCCNHFKIQGLTIHEIKICLNHGLFSQSVALKIRFIALLTNKGIVSAVVETAFLAWLEITFTFWHGSSAIWIESSPMSKVLIGGAYFCPVSHMYKCVVRNGNVFFAYPTPPRRPQSGVTARDQPLLMATLEQLGVSALLESRSTDFSPSRLGDSNFRLLAQLSNPVPGVLPSCKFLSRTQL